jgi:hypothetical protein
MLATTLCRDSDPADSSDKGIFGASAPCIPAVCSAKEQGGRLSGHSGSRVYRRDPECLWQSWWEVRVDAVAQAVEAVTNNALIRN